MTKKQDINFDNLTAIPVAPSIHPQKIWKLNREKPEKNLTYTYLGFYNGRILRYVSLFFSGLIECFRWVRKHRDTKDKVIICDPLVPTVAFAARMIGKLYGIKVVAIILDMPNLVTSISAHRKNLKDKVLRKLYDNFVTNELQRYDAFILITESMNQIVNKEQQKPFLIIEGSVDSNMKNIKKENNKSTPSNRTVVYAGGVNEKFGVGSLVRAFEGINLDNVVLKIYGTGDYVDEVKEIAKHNPKIRYMGIVPVDEIVKEEVVADLLVNPRPTNETFTKYSFPSKTLEYMSTGTAVLSTRLEGIPKEYNDYLYWIDDESDEGIRSKLEELLVKPLDELNFKGLSAKNFVLENKNCDFQGQRIIDFIKKKVL
jgi:glycosyltransferase involved in cell wall biosynthesis